MRFWFFLFLVLPLLGMVYVLWHVWQILPLSQAWRWVVIVAMALCLLVFFGNFSLWNIDDMPAPAARFLYELGNSSLFLLLYLFMIFLLMDVGKWCHLIPLSWVKNSLYGTVTVLLLMLSLFTYGYFNYMHKTRETQTLTTAKTMERPLKIILLSDLHLGYHNPVTEFNRWVDIINAEHPDLVLIGGDIIDGHIRPLYEQHADEAFHRILAPVVACLGNHEYYTGLAESLQFYHDAGITLLRDSSMTFKGINIVGRDDRANPHRMALRKLMQQVDTTRFTILLDHQPYHLEQAQQCGVDFQFSGHTHYGQVWPISWIEDAMYEDAFGPLTKGNTQYYVSSGIGIWGAKFRIGTRSEYLVLNVRQEPCR